MKENVKEKVKEEVKEEVKDEVKEYGDLPAGQTYKFDGKFNVYNVVCKKIICNFCLLICFSASTSHSHRIRSPDHLYLNAFLASSHLAWNSVFSSIALSCGALCEG